MRAIGYFRELPDERTAGDSLTRQNSAFLDFCKREGYETAATFIDSAETNGDRGGLRQLFAHLQRPEKGFVVVVVSDIRRLGDELREAARAYFRIESLGAHVVLMDDPGDSLAHLVKAWEKGGRSAAGERIRSAMRRKAVRGEVLGRPPYGYAVGPKRRLELVPEEAAVVRYVYRLYLHEELGIRLIARRLNEEDLKTRRGGNWSMVSLRDMLRNRAYLGTYSRFGVRVPGSHPALVSPEDFRHVQDRMSSRRTAGQRDGDAEPKRARTPFLLSGLLHCGACGNRMIGVSRRQRWVRRSDGAENAASYRYYQCESRTNQSLCDYHTRRAEDLESEVRRALVEGSATQPVLRTGNEDRVRAEAEERIAQIRGRLAALDKRLEGGLDAAAQGEMLKDRLLGESLAIARDSLALETELVEAEDRLRRQFSQAERTRRRDSDLDEIATRWERMRPERRRALMREMIDRVVVSDEAVQVQLRP